ncbi:Hypothetical predicted protein [Mytilus galloprovincialis]|uniref:Mitochondrial import receptor subunit TOM7 homolog n=1 Tax=Mytilus galloprovincialis TaxID=29158 RepID=A0A8B6HJA4_MYTGA|nr:Hypothetical predicted protein [Mytilus galloprovincialis]
MADMSPEAKKRLSSVLKLVRVTFQYGFIPTVLYMGNLGFRNKKTKSSIGFKRGADEGMPPLELASILWG